MLRTTKAIMHSLRHDLDPSDALARLEKKEEDRLKNAAAEPTLLMRMRREFGVKYQAKLRAAEDMADGLVAAAVRPEPTEPFERHPAKPVPTPTPTPTPSASIAVIDDDMSKVYLRKEHKDRNDVLYTPGEFLNLLKTEFPLPTTTTTTPTTAEPATRKRRNVLAALTSNLDPVKKTRQEIVTVRPAAPAAPAADVIDDDDDFPDATEPLLPASQYRRDLLRRSALKARLQRDRLVDNDKYLLERVASDLRTELEMQRTNLRVMQVPGMPSPPDDVVLDIMDKISDLKETRLTAAEKLFVLHHFSDVQAVTKAAKTAPSPEATVEAAKRAVGRRWLTAAEQAAVRDVVGVFHGAKALAEPVPEPVPEPKAATAEGPSHYEQLRALIAEIDVGKTASFAALVAEARALANRRGMAFDTKLDTRLIRDIVRVPERNVISDDVNKRVV